MNIRQFFSFEEREGRLRFFLTGVGNGMMTLASFFLFFQLLNKLGVKEESPSLIALGFLIPTFFCCWIEFSSIIRRLHDLDRPGNHILFNFIPIYNMYFSFMLLFKQGSPGANRFGENPIKPPFADRRCR